MKLFCHARIYILLLLITLFSSGCALLSSSPEPPQVALRNSSGEKLAGISVSEAEKKMGQGVRLGSISPAAKGETYVFVRKENAEGLPREGIVAWQNYRGAYRKVTVQIKDVLRSATGSPGETLVFELKAGGRVDAYLETIHR